MSSDPSFVNYVARMNDAIHDKHPFIKVIKNLIHSNMSEDILGVSLANLNRPPENKIRILDFGCGGGALTSAIASEFSHGIYCGESISIVGYDKSYDMVEVSQGYYADRENLSFTSNKASLGKNCFDIIILSSVLHEVYSEGGEAGVEKLFDDLKQFAKPNAVIISRDNWAANDDEGRQLFLKARPDKVEYLLELFIRLKSLLPTNFADHYRDAYYNYHPQKQLDEDDTVCAPIPTNLTLSGSFNTVVEILNKATWGMESLPRESQEILFWLSADKWRELNLHGWRIIAQAETTSDSYLDYINRIFDLNGERWPTHMWTLLKLE